MLIKNLTITDLKKHNLIEDFTFTLGSNDKTGIIGEEGNGKSTLLKAIYDRKMIDDYTSISGSIDTQNQKIAMFTQTLSSDWDSVFIWEYLLKKEFGDEIEDYNELAVYEQECINYRIDPELIQRDQQMNTLSGGEKVKLRLLKVLHNACDVLLLDEPTNDLDIETLEWLEVFLKQLTIPLMFISHDEILLEKVSNRIIHLEQLNKKSKCKTTIWNGSYELYVQSRSTSLKKEEQLAKKEKAEYLKKKVKLNDIQNAVHDALNDCVRNPGMAAMLKKKMTNIKAMEKRFEKESYRKVDSVEEAIDVYFELINMPKDKKILDIHEKSIIIDKVKLFHISDFEVYGNTHVVITGKNGCGKTVFLKELNKILEKREGIRLGYMPQTYLDEFIHFDTPVQFLLEEGDVLDVSRSRELLGRMKFTTEEMMHDIHALSEGQKAKLFLLRFIKWKCDVLLLDEPTRNLSPLTNPMIRHILKQYGGCIISVSHDRKYIEEVSDTVYEIKQNQIIRLS